MDVVISSKGTYSDLPLHFNTFFTFILVLRVNLLRSLNLLV